MPLVAHQNVLVLGRALFELVRDQSRAVDAVAVCVPVRQFAVRGDVSARPHAHEAWSRAIERSAPSLHVVLLCGALAHRSLLRQHTRALQPLPWWTVPRVRLRYGHIERGVLGN